MSFWHSDPLPRWIISYETIAFASPWGMAAAFVLLQGLTLVVAEVGGHIVASAAAPDYHDSLAAAGLASLLLLALQAVAGGSIGFILSAKGVDAYWPPRTLVDAAKLGVTLALLIVWTTWIVSGFHLLPAAPSPWPSVVLGAAGLITTAAFAAFGKWHRTRYGLPRRDPVPDDLDLPSRLIFPLVIIVFPGVLAGVGAAAIGSGLASGNDGKVMLGVGLLGLGGSMLLALGGDPTLGYASP